MSELPAGWTRARIADLGVVQLGRQRSPEHHSGPMMRPYLRVANVFEGRIDTEDVMKMNFSDEEFARFRLAPGDILLNEGQSKDLVGRPAIYSGEVPGACFTNSLVRFRAGAAVDTKFAFYLFLHFFKSGAFQRIAKITTNIAHLGADRFGQLEAAIPPLVEQRRIVGRLEECLARSRGAKASLGRLPALLDRLRQSILAAAFRGDLTKAWREAHPEAEPADKLLERIRVERRRKWEDDLRARWKDPRKARYEEPEPVDASGLPELPRGWAWATSAALVEPGAEIVYGIVQPGAEVPAGVPYVRGLDIQDGKILVAQLRHTSHAIAARYDRASLRGGDVLLGIIRATKVAVVPPELEGANITQGTARFRPSAAIRTQYLAGWLETPFAQNWLHARYRGIDMPGLNLADVRRLPVPLAPLEEQRVIEDRVRGALGRVPKLLTGIAEHVTRLEQSLLAKAFRGELVPQDPADERASVLLDRIRAEREAHTPPKSRQATRAAKIARAQRTRSRSQTP